MVVSRGIGLNRAVMQQQHLTPNGGIVGQIRIAQQEVDLLLALPDFGAQRTPFVNQCRIQKDTLTAAFWITWSNSFPSFK